MTKAAFSAEDNDRLRGVLRKVLSESGAPQRLMASLLGITQSSLWSFLSGSSNMSRRTAAALANFLGRSVADLLQTEPGDLPPQEIRRAFDLKSGSLHSVEGIATRINQRMRDIGMTAADVAKVSNLTLATVQTICRADLVPDQREMKAIAEAIGVDVGWLYSGVSAPSEPINDDAPHLHLSNRIDYAQSIHVARSLRPQHGDYVWEELAVSAPLVTVPITPALLADLADVLAKYLVPPRGYEPKRK